MADIFVKQGFIEKDRKCAICCLLLNNILCYLKVKVSVYFVDPEVHKYCCFSENMSIISSYYDAMLTRLPDNYQGQRWEIEFNTYLLDERNMVNYLVKYCNEINKTKFIKYSHIDDINKINLLSYKGSHRCLSELTQKTKTSRD